MRIKSMQQAKVNIMITDKEGLNWLKTRLMSVNGNFRNTQLYKVLKAELQMLGYWRNLARGNPAKGLKAMQQAKGKHHNE